MTPEQITRNFVCDPAILTDARQALDSLDSYPALNKILRARPLDTLTFIGSHRAIFDTIKANGLIAPDHLRASDNDVTCGGFYNPYKNILAINTGYKNDRRIQAMSLRYSCEVTGTPQIAFTVPLAKIDTVLMIHEISHMVDYRHVRKDSTLGRFVQEAAWSAYESRRFVSEYASTCPDEWFAETMSAYVIHPEVLKDFDPLAFSAMKAVLETPTKGQIQ
jgi:hypothetical protein